jgi:hypothetical protein
VHQHHRQRVRRMSGLVAAVAAVGLACGAGLPALASSATATRPAASTAAARPNAAPGSGRQLLLVNGDRLVIRSAGGGQQIAVRHASSQDAVISLRVGGQTTEIPVAALPYLGRGLSPSLFEVGALEKAESGGRLPVQLTFTGQRPAIPGLTLTRSAAGAASGYLTTPGARQFGAALERQFRADHSSGRFGRDGLFGHRVSISLAGSPAARGAGPTPAFPMHTLTVDGQSLGGKPDTGDSIFIANADNLNRFSGVQANDNFFFHGAAKFSVPAGHYWAIATFVNFTKNNGALRMVVVPQFTVAGSHTTLRVAAKAASSEFTTATPLPAVNQQSTFQINRGARSGGVFSFSQSVSGLSLWVNPTTRKPAVGTLRTFSSATLTSPNHVSPTYAYNLDFPGPAGTIPSQHFVVGPTNLATVTERYYQDVRSAGGWLAFGGTAAQFSGFVFAEILPVTMPQQQTQFFSAGGGIVWQNETLANLDQFSGGDTDGVRTYAPGEQQTQDWNRYPLHPAPDVNLPGSGNFVLNVPSAARTGNTLLVGVTPFSDNQFGHLGAGFFLNGNASVTGSYVVDQNGKQIAHGNAVNGVPPLKLTAKPSVIRFVLNATRSSSFFRLSPSSQTIYTWRSVRNTSAHVPNGWFCNFAFRKNQLILLRQCAVQPMMTLNYGVEGLSLSGLTTPGAQVLDLTAGHIQLGGTPAITGATAQVSYNDGDSFTPATVSPQGAGHFRIAYTAPPGVDVTLRVTASDSAGSSISETIVRAYGVSP